ncbi:MAG: hypothetical protein OEV80_13540, partial [candidate division Zixibacteria bacterium]|nr:hypothetical protein [candidate division Zixibacteria bacterium]
CQEAVAQYQMLFDGLADEHDIRLPADFAATVAAQLPATKPVETTAERWSMSTVLGVAGPLLMIAVTIYILGYQSLLTGFDGFSTGAVGLLTGLFTAAGEFLLRYGLRADLIGFAALLLVTIGLTDRLLRALRHGKAMLMA